MRTGTIRDAAFRREVLQLSILIVVTVAAFFVTRAFASSNRTMNRRDAAEWYRQGRADESAGRPETAVAAFRRATARDRTERRYALALARALARTGSADEARRTLTALRESAPEDGEVNLDLARLSAASRDVTSAIRFYQSALYAPWPLGQEDARRRVRVELIRFLIANGQANRAQGEVLALRSDLPDDAPHQVEIAALFAATGDHRRALDSFRRALEHDPENPDALAGAGRAAFELGDDLAARDYLRAAPSDRADVQQMRAIADLAIANDPWRPRLGSAERRRRVIAGVEHVRTRLETCLGQRTTPPTDIESALQTETRLLAGNLASSATLEQDAMESAFDVIARIERDVLPACGPAAPLDRALLRIERHHGGDTR